jgi:hypothetical protein
MANFSARALSSRGVVLRVSSRQARRVRCALPVRSQESVGAFGRRFGVLGGRTPGGHVLTGSLGSADAFSAGSIRSAGAGQGKLPVELVSLARRSKRPDGVRRQYAVAGLFPSITY